MAWHGEAESSLHEFPGETHEKPSEIFHTSNHWWTVRGQAEVRK